MDFSLSEEQLAIRKTFHDFAEREIRPRARELDESPRFPRELITQIGQLGFFGMRYPPPHGNGADLVSYLLAVEEIAWGSLAVAAACTMQSLMGTWFVYRLAPADVRDRLLPAALLGEKIGTICMTEPEAGSDLGSIATRAVESDGGWTVTGSKTWITSAPVADFFTVFARTGPETLGLFLVERGAAGLEVGRSIDKLGVRASLTSELHFSDVPALPLGDPTAGGKHLREILAEARLVTAALALGIGRAALEEARSWAGQRRQFGKTIDQFQAIQAHLADSAVELEAARHLTEYAAWKNERGMPAATDAAMAKLFASEAAHKSCERAARVHASWGFAADSPVQRYLRDVRFVLIGGGTSEILKTFIARSLK
jgi:alkylation response protein AidB-like acyl-CoA dehydrogenase